MSSHAILDSSPMAIPSVRPLKRSASIASLPTPPRTHRKRTSSHSHDHDTDSDSSSVGDEGGDEGEADDGRLVIVSKKRRTALQKNGQEIEEEENVFWMSSKAGSGTAASSQTKSKTATSKSNSQTTTSRSPSTSVSPTPLLYRLAHREPVSPPPSHRQSQFQPKSRHATPPVTPKHHTSAARTKGPYPVRDSPNNPFLADTPLSVSPSDILDLERLRTPSPADYTEKPTITYVFRGVKAKFSNPLYKADSSSATGPATPPPHTLPLSDPEYSPDLRCPPRLLFKAARRLQDKKGMKTRRGGAAVSEGELDGKMGLENVTFARELALMGGRRNGGDTRS